MAALAKNRSFTAKSSARQARTLKPFTVPEGLVTLAHAQWMLLALGPGSSRLSGVIFLCFSTVPSYKTSSSLVFLPGDGKILIVLSCGRRFSTGAEK